MARLRNILLPLSCLSLASLASAQTFPSTQTDADRPALRELDRQTQSLYRELEAGMFRCQLPESGAQRREQNNWIVNKYSPLLNGEMKRQLGEQNGQAANPGNASDNGPAQSNSAQPQINGQSLNPSGLTILVPRQVEQQAQLQNTVQPQQQLQAGPAANGCIGLLLDHAGHVLVPQYLDRDATGEQPIRIVGAAGSVLEAKLVGSDQQTGLSVLQCIPPAAYSRPAAAQPVPLDDHAPRDGALVLLLSPTDGAGRLGVFNGGGRDAGIVVNIDGKVAGIARSGQFLSGSACQLIADQIIRNGAVRRATLGVMITQIDADDPLRRAQPLLGDKPAVRVDQVMPNSAAARAGLRPGDILLKLDNEPTKDIPTIAAAIAARNGPTHFQVLRDARVVDLTVDLIRK